MPPGTASTDHGNWDAFHITFNVFCAVYQVDGQHQIKAGYWHEAERLPTEAELALTLNVAVDTLRKALALLADQDVLQRVQGSGTCETGEQHPSPLRTLSPGAHHRPWPAHSAHP